MHHLCLFLCLCQQVRLPYSDRGCSNLGNGTSTEHCSATRSQHFQNIAMFFNSCVYVLKLSHCSTSNEDLSETQHAAFKLCYLPPMDELLLLYLCNICNSSCVFTADITVSTAASTCPGPIFLVYWHQILSSRSWSRDSILPTQFLSPTLSIYLLLINCPHTTEGFATVPTVLLWRPSYVSKAKVTPGLVSQRVVYSKHNKN